MKALLNRPTPDLILPSTSSTFTQQSTPSGFLLGHGGESHLPPKIVTATTLPPPPQEEGGRRLAIGTSGRPSIVRVTSSNPQQLSNISLLGTAAAKPATTFTTITNRHNLTLKSQPSPIGEF